MRRNLMKEHWQQMVFVYKFWGFVIRFFRREWRESMNLADFAARLTYWSDDEQWAGLHAFIEKSVQQEMEMA